MIFYIGVLVGISILVISFRREKRDVGAWALFILGLISIVVSLALYYSDKAENLALKDSIEKSAPAQLQKKIDFSNIASLDDVGKPFTTTGPIGVETGLSKILAPYIHEDNSHTKIECTPEAISSFAKAIDMEPKYPFSYYYLASCEKIKGSIVWNSHMKRALEIFEITTQIAGHNEEHDQALKDIHTRFGL